MKRAYLCAMASALAAVLSLAACGPEAAGSRVEASAAAPANLVDLGNGLVYDQVLDVTWLQDANYARTSGHSPDGLMTFGDASTWVANLNYGGTRGWRLPTFDPSNTRPAVATSANEIGSLLGALTGGRFTWPSPADTSPFVNLLGGPVEPVYWTGLAGQPGTVWDYHMTCG